MSGVVLISECLENGELDDVLAVGNGIGFVPGERCPIPGEGEESCGGAVAGQIGFLERSVSGLAARAENLHPHEPGLMVEVDEEIGNVGADQGEGSARRPVVIACPDELGQPGESIST
jgi:hypothetical protein